MSRPIPRCVAHLARNDPDKHVGGVSAFARNLRLVFGKVVFFTPGYQDWAWVRRERIPVICDNQWVNAVPDGIPAIGFQHGVAEIKRKQTGSLTDRILAWQQQRAARRPNTVWVACAQWIAEASRSLYGTRTVRVIYHQVDLQRFDGRLDNRGSHLILHDARSNHKGKKQLAWLREAFPAWRFEPLACEPALVAERMRNAAAFVHLSRYEGNSIVCNEAMAHNLPCLFTRVGLMQDKGGPTDVTLLDPAAAFNDKAYLIAKTAAFLDRLGTVAPNPRAWVLTNASPDATIASWKAVLALFDALPWNK